MRTINDNVRVVSVNHNGKWTGTKPRTIQFGEHKLFVKDWTDALQKMCDKIADEKSDDFHLVERCIGWNRMPYFDKEDNMEDHHRKYKIRSTGLYVRCNLSANNVKELCDALSCLFDYGPAITVTLR